MSAMVLVITSMIAGFCLAVCIDMARDGRDPTQALCALALAAVAVGGSVIDFRRQQT